jgi:hypothetical protein
MPRGLTADTAFLAVIGPETMWRLDAPVTLADIKDGTDQTLTVVEVEDSRVNWLEPTDLDLAQMRMAINPRPGHGISSPHGNGAWGLCVNGAVYFLPNDLKGAALRGLFTIAGGESAQIPKTSAIRAQ